MELPIVYKLKRKSQRDLAELQDEAMEVVYEIFENAVIHGGTAIWRCYNGKRFSEDIDLYAKCNGDFKELLEKSLKRRGLKLIRSRRTANTVFSEISNDIVSMKLEITNEIKKGVLAIYEKANGGTLEVLTLRPQDLLLEKLAAYLSRRKVRDVYDVYFLSRLVNDIEVKREADKLLKKIERPVDEDDLKAIIYEGKVPAFEEMLEALRLWVKSNI